jgi:hypothetical protein
VEIFVVIVGLIVAIGTPVGTYIATVQGHKAGERNASTTAQATLAAACEAADAARHAAEKAAEAARDTAAVSAQTARDERRESRLKWACEAAWSDNADAKAGGVSVLRSMIHAGTLDREALIIVAGALDAALEPAINRVGDDPVEKVAELPPAGKAGQSREPREG